MFRRKQCSVVATVNGPERPKQSEPTRCYEHLAGSHHNHPLITKGPVMATSDSTTARPRLNITKEVTAMERMTVAQLRAKYAEVFGEPTKCRHKERLIKRIAWRMQANAEGGLSELAHQRAMELVNDADLRMTPPRPPKVAANAQARTTTMATKLRPHTELLPGTVLQREYKGQTVRVTVLVDGFEYAGERYKSLTAVAKVVTSKHWNGFHFFGLRQQGGAQ